MKKNSLTLAFARKWQFTSLSGKLKVLKQINGAVKQTEIFEKRSNDKKEKKFKQFARILSGVRLASIIHQLV